MSQVETFLTKKDVITKWMMNGDSKNFSEYESDAERYLSELIWSFKNNIMEKTVEEYFDSNISLTIQMI